jgi:ABC-type nitrate/sulfonate/bicarbonate transport system ATPase subunit
MAQEEVGPCHLGRQFPDRFSLGQQRRLALARAFSAAPDLPLLDESFVSLDLDLVQGMLILTERSLSGRQITTILVTHTPAEAKRLATRMVRQKVRAARLAPFPRHSCDGRLGLDYTRSELWI